MTQIFMIDTTHQINTTKFNKNITWYDKNKSDITSNYFYHTLHNNNNNMVDYSQNALVKCVEKAFYDHYPLELSPDIIWMAICQGFSLHVNLNAEKLRNKFVDHTDQKTLLVVIDNIDFKNKLALEEAVSKFTYLLDSELNQGLFDPSIFKTQFSTTNHVEMMAQKIVLMDTVKKYFEYEAYCGCGITELHLKGTIEDWYKIKTSLQKMKGFEIDWWIDIVDDVIDDFIKTAAGTPDIEFWKSIAILYGGSGYKQPLSGWICTLFPYYRSNNGSWSGPGVYKLHEALKTWKTKPVEVNSEMFPSGQNSVPVKFIEYNTRKETKTLGVAGFFGIEQDPNTFVIRPKIGWGFKIDDGKAGQEKY